MMGIGSSGERDVGRERPESKRAALVRRGPRERQAELEDPELSFWLQDPDANPWRFTRVNDAWVRTAEIAISATPKRALRRVEPIVRARDDRYLTLAEASVLVRTPSETIRYWVWQGRLQAFKPGRAVLVRESELLELVAGRETRRIRAGRTKTRA